MSTRFRCAPAGAFAVLCLTATVQAEPLAFLNATGPDRFKWGFALTQDTAQALDVTRPFNEQRPIGASFRPGAGFWLFRGENFSGEFSFGRMQHTSSDGPSLAGVASLDRVVPVNFSVGDTVGSSARYPRLGWVNVYLFGGGRSFVFEDRPVFFGLSMMLRGGSGQQRHFGWVGVAWSETRRNLDVFAWGYETTPYTPITIPDIPLPAIPAPGAAVALGAFGAIMGASRRRC